MLNQLLDSYREKLGPGLMFAAVAVGVGYGISLVFSSSERSV